MAIKLTTKNIIIGVTSVLIVVLVVTGIVLITQSDSSQNDQDPHDKIYTQITHQISQGEITGRQYNNLDFGYGAPIVFYGIPYAEAPIGENRFLAPKFEDLGKISWSGVRNGFDRAPMCLQYGDRYTGWIQGIRVVRDESCDHRFDRKP